jgi:hypothetical protein
LDRPATVVKTNANNRIRAAISKMRSAATVAIPVVTETPRFCLSSTGRASSPTRPGRTQFIMKPIIKGWNACQNLIRSISPRIICQRKVRREKVAKTKAVTGTIHQ